MGTDGVATLDGAKPGTENAQTQTPETFTKEQLEKAVRDAKSAVLADAGRMKTEAEKALKAATAAQNRLAQLEKEREEAELEAVRDEPDKLAVIRERQRRKAIESELENARAQLSEREAALAEYKTKQTEAQKHTLSQEIAGRLQVDSATLAKLAKYTDGTAEAIEDIAKSLPKVNAQPEPFRPYSNRSQGGTTQGVQDVRKDYASGKINAIQYEEKMKALGYQP